MATIVTDRRVASSDTSVYFSLQTNKGVINTSPVFSKAHLRVDGVFKPVISFVQSSAVSNRRQGKSNIKDTTEYTGEINFELNKQTAIFLDAIIHGTQVNNGVTLSTLSANSVGFVDSGNSAFTNIVAGDWFNIIGLTNSANNTKYKVLTKNSNGDVVTYTPPVATEAEGPSVTIESSKTANGSDQTYLTVQNRTTDKSIAGDVNYETFIDAFIDTGSFSIPVSGIVTGTLAMKAEQVVSSSLSIAGQTDTANETSESAGATDTVRPMMVNGVAANCGVKSIDFSFSNSYQIDLSAGCNTNSYAMGDSIEVGGAIETVAVVSDTFNWKRIFESQTNKSIAILFEWPDSTWMIIDILAAKITEHSMPNGANTVSSNSMTYSAEEDTTLESTVHIFRNF
ncbi:MAG: hypothetical protein ACJAYB_000007 [Psychromonas sp.]|jgi:hypothetical protein